MTTKVLIPVFLFLSYQISAQSEFEVYDNGLIYSEATMARLRHIADSLDLRFRTCQFDKMYYSLYQVKAHKIILDTGDIKKAKRDIDNVISIEDFLKKYPLSKHEDILVIKYTRTSYTNDQVVVFREISPSRYYEISIEEPDTGTTYTKSVRGTWLYNYQDQTSYSDENLNAFYFSNDFKSIPIGKEYSYVVGYADCMIDTTTSKFTDNLKDTWVELPPDWQTLSAPDKEKLLTQLRSSLVIGNCSQDRRPRTHAKNIAIMSAETAHWEVFMKAHLNIMNDYFSRNSDGSYAQPARKTYIRELEELNINIVDLIVGIMFRIENPAQLHYMGDIGRLGRAIAESNVSDQFETRLLEIVKDQNLDEFNRLIAFNFLKSFAYYLPDESKRILSRLKLAEAITTFPSYLIPRLSVE